MLVSDSPSSTAVVKAPSPARHCSDPNRTKSSRRCARGSMGVGSTHLSKHGRALNSPKRWSTEKAGPVRRDHLLPARELNPSRWEDLLLAPANYIRQGGKDRGRHEQQARSGEKQGKKPVLLADVLRAQESSRSVQHEVRGHGEILMRSRALGSQWHQ